MRLITLAIHTFPHASALKQVLEREGIAVTLQNVNLEEPHTSAGVRVRIHEHDLPLALRIVENPEIFAPAEGGVATVTAVTTAMRGGRTRGVLLPVDFSEAGRRAAKAAFALAAAHHTGVTLLHAYASPSRAALNPLAQSLTYADTSAATKEADRNVAQKARTAIEAFAAELKRDIRDGHIEAAPFDTLCVEGLPEDAINDAAKARAPLAIVMGTRSADSRRREMMGSVTAEVLDTCRRTVLTVPETVDLASPAELSKGLCLVGPDQLDIAAIDMLVRLLPPCSRSARRITLANMPQRKGAAVPAANASALENLAGYCRSQWPETEFVTLPLRPETAVMETMRKTRLNEFDFIAVPNRRRNLIARFFNPGPAHRILFHSSLPMLVIPV